MKISVTQDDILLGQQAAVSRCGCCPLARAIARAVGKEVCVTRHGLQSYMVSFYDKSVWLPVAAGVFAQQADRLQGFATGLEPFEFELEVS